YGGGPAARARRDGVRALWEAARTAVPGAGSATGGGTGHAVLPLPLQARQAAAGEPGGVAADWPVGDAPSGSRLPARAVRTSWRQIGTLRPWRVVPPIGFEPTNGLEGRRSVH